MAGERLPMQNTREILGPCWSLGRTVRQTARGLGISSGTVSKTTTRGTAVGLSWELVTQVSDSELDERCTGSDQFPASSVPSLT